MPTQKEIDDRNARFDAEDSERIKMTIEWPDGKVSRCSVVAKYWPEEAHRLIDEITHKHWLRH